MGGGGQEPVRIDSTPSGAHVEVVDKRGTVVHNGVTPMTVTLNRGAGFFQPAVYTVRTTATPATGAFRPVGVAAVAPRQAQLTAGLNGWYLGNILFPGIIGALIDPATGAMFNLPNEFNVDDPDGRIAKQKPPRK